MPHCAACQRRFRRGETAGEVALLVPFAAEEADADEYMSAVICSKCADMPVMEKTEGAIASLREIIPSEIVNRAGRRLNEEARHAGASLRRSSDVTEARRKPHRSRCLP